MIRLAIAAILLALGIQSLDAASFCCALASATPSFYVASTGNDSNVGSAASPFLTANKCDTAMTGSATTKMCTFLTNLTISSWNIHSQEVWTSNFASPVTLTLSAVNIGCSSCNNVTIKNLKFAGSATGTAYFAFSAASGIFIQSDTFTITSNIEALSLFNNDDEYIQGNTFNGSTTNSLDVVSTPINDNKNHNNIYVTDNTFSGCDRWCLEMQNQTSGTMTNYHVDRNTFSNFEGTHGQCNSGAPFGGASIVYGNAAGNHDNTFWGNTLTTPSTANTCVLALEMTTGGMSIENNEFDFQSYIFQIAQSNGTEMENNTIKMALSNTVASTPINSWGQDGGFTTPVAFWIGTNTIFNTSSVSNSVTGCLSGGGTSPGYCALGTNTFPSKPTVYSPSPVFVGG